MTAKLPLTVAAAKAAGWTAIQAECVGHQITQIPWTMIDGDPERTLASIVTRLRCRRCGKPPSAVYLHRPVPGRGYGLPSEQRLAITHMGRLS
jgi:hypothetical protein